MIQILGTRGEIEETSPGHKKFSGVLIDKVLFDLGETEYLKLKPQAIVITHLHPDHAYFTRKKGKEYPELKDKKLFLPEPWSEFKKNHVSIYKKLEPLKIGGMKIVPIPTVHSKKVKSFAMLINFKGKKILYTSDMIWINKRYQPLIKDCDLVITEGSFMKKGGMIRRDKKTGEVFGHQGIPNLVKLFKSLSAKSIVITHFGKWFVDNLKEGERKIKELSDNKVKVWAAKDGEKIGMEELQTTKEIPKILKSIIMKIKEKVCPVCNKIFPSIEALRVHMKKEHPEEYNRLKEFLSKPLRGLYLVPPHGTMIFDGEKTLILKKRKYHTDPKEPLYLLEGDLAFGTIYLGRPIEIGSKDFKRLEEKHKVSDSERKKWWGDKWPLYIYNFKLEKFPKPRRVKIPKGVQTFVKSKNIEWLTKEELIADWKSYDPMKLIRTKGGRRILADDHRIVHTWWNRLKKGKAMKSPQFKNYSLEEQKDIVKKLHESIVEAFKKLGWKHRSPLGAESLIESPIKVKVKDLEEINPTYVQGLSDKELKVLYRRLHWLYHNILRKITEPLQNAHIFVLKELDKRNLRFRKVGDHLDHIAERIVEEYPTPRGFASGKEMAPEVQIDQFSKELSLKEVTDSFPDLIVLEEDPVHVYLCGGTVNKGKKLKGHDIDLLFKQNFPDARIIHQFVDELSSVDRDLGRSLHFVWDPWGPTIGYSVPLYRLAFKKIIPSEKKSPYEYLAQAIRLMVPFRPLKPKSGFHKFEFFDIEEMWDKWAAKVIDKGLVVQEKYDGMRLQVHVKGNQVKIITEDKRRDRTAVFKKSLKELLANKKANNFILDTEMVEYNCRGKEVRDKQQICEKIKREEMIKWIASTKKALDDQDIVFHIHDCLFFEGKDIHEKGYQERWETIVKCLPDKLKHWRRAPSFPAKNVKEFYQAVKKARTMPGSEGVVAKIKDSPYSLKGRTNLWAKLKNLKEIDVMVWDIQQKKTAQGGLLNQWIYYPVFLVPCNMKAQIREDQFIEWKGKCYSRLGRAYGTKVRCKRGDIITVRPVQIVENKNPKTGKIWWTWMFPYFEEKKVGKKEPDTLTTVRRIVKVGTSPLSEDLAQVIRLPDCPYWNDASICPLRERFYVPPEEESLSVLEEYLKIPIICRFANRFKCHFVKDYYYDLRPRKERLIKEEETEYMEED